LPGEGPIPWPSVTALSERGRYRIGRRKKWPEKVRRREIYPSVPSPLLSDVSDSLSNCLVFD